MATCDRRRLLRTAGLAAAGFALARPALALGGMSPITVPVGPFILRRELERGLARGASLLVVREWQGRFDRSVEGVRVTGKQVSCTVEAPEVLEPIAEIERRRISPGPFPARLDGRGRIVGTRSPGAGGKAAAIAAALAVLEDAGKSAAELENARQQLGRLANASGAVISETPPDLFFPVVGNASESRDVLLPGEIVGNVTVRLAAKAQRTGLLESFERKITTRIGEETRESRETWRLKLA